MNTTWADVEIALLQLSNAAYNNGKTDAEEHSTAAYKRASDEADATLARAKAVVHAYKDNKPRPPKVRL